VRVTIPDVSERRSAWIAEDSADDDFLLASGRFRAHIEIDLGDESRLGEELEDASLEEALQWARQRAPRVLVRLWDTDYFSAGEINPDPERFSPLPPDALTAGPRRPRGLEALDNTEKDPPVLWDVRLHAQDGADEAAFRAVVEADPRTHPVPPEAIDGRLQGVRVLVQASTQDQAGAIADEISQHAQRASGAPIPTPPPGGWMLAAGYEVYPFAPDAPVIFGGAATRVRPGVVDTGQDHG
jgi:hypothetical protein